MEAVKNIPNESGFYWAKKNGYKWFNLIVRIYGTKPFLEWIAWDMGMDEKLIKGKGEPGFIFGAKIEEQEDK